MLRTYVCPYCGEYHEATTYELETEDTYVCAFCLSTVELDSNELNDNKPVTFTSRTERPERPERTERTDEYMAEKYHLRVNNICYLTEPEFDDFLYF